MFGAAGFITPVLVTYLGSTTGAVIGALPVGIYAALPVSIEFFRLLCGGSDMVVVLTPGD
jgi:hypothetical protein